MRNLILAVGLVVCSGTLLQADAGVRFHHKRHPSHEVPGIQPQSSPVDHSLTDDEAAENAALYSRGRLVAPYGGVIWSQ